AGSTLEIHREEKRPDNEAGYAGSNILNDLPALFVGQFFDANIVGFDFSADLRATGSLILRLYGGDELWITSSTGAQNKARRRDKSNNTHDYPPVPGSSSCKDDGTS